MKMKGLPLLLASAFLLMPSVLHAYPNGTPFYATDTGPFCASCHSAAKAEYMAELPPEASAKETPEMKHYGLIRMPGPPSPYAELTQEQKDGIINTAKLIDSKSSVVISAPLKAKANSEIKVTVKAVGGNGPVIGIMLVDRVSRFQARPVSSEGWTIAGEPLVRGQDGAIQTKWLEKRHKDFKRNLNFVIIEGLRYDPLKETYPAGEVAYTLKAPPVPGAYTLAAAFLYGTENAEKAGFFQRPSGRILFSEEIRVQVE